MVLRLRISIGGKYDKAYQNLLYFSCHDQKINLDLRLIFQNWSTPSAQLTGEKFRQTGPGFLDFNSAHRILAAYWQ